MTDEENNKFFYELSCEVIDKIRANEISSSKALKFAIDLLIMYGLENNFSQTNFERLALDVARDGYSENLNKVRKVMQVRSSPEHIMQAMGLGDWENFEGGEWITANDKFKRMKDE